MDRPAPHAADRRPPAPYRLAYSGRYYEVWQRPPGAARPPAGFLPLGGSADPAALPDCAALKALAAKAPPGARLLAAPHAPLYGASQGPFRLPRAGIYEAWLGGSVRSEVELSVDGRRFGAARHVLSEDGGFIALGSARLAAGAHRAALRFGGPDLDPGSAPGGLAPPPTGALLFTPARRRPPQLVSVSSSQAGRLCGHRWDWIELPSG